MTINVAASETTNIVRKRKPTVLIHMGSVSLSKKAFLIGLSLVLLQIADGLLTYAGLKIYGVEFEGNALLRELMLSHGCAASILFFTKGMTVMTIIWLTFMAHEKRWIRPIMGILSGIFFTLAVVPWSILILNS